MEEDIYSKKECIMGIVRGIVPVVVTVLTIFGISADADILITVIGSILSIVTFICSWWKNNNITLAAQQAQKVLDDLKSGEEELDDGGE